jgi:hypothetical protein
MLVIGRHGAKTPIVVRRASWSKRSMALRSMVTEFVADG